MERVSGTVYLICFERNFHHARHYLGFSEDHEKREERHINGDGAKILAAVDRAGIAFQVVRTWSADRYFERWLKRRKGTSHLCPRCNPKALALPTEKSLKRYLTKKPKRRKAA